MGPQSPSGFSSQLRTSSAAGVPFSVLVPFPVPPPLTAEAATAPVCD